MISDVDVHRVIRTVLGDIPPESAGPTLVHEHMISSALAYWKPETDFKVATSRLTLETLQAAKRNIAACRDNLLMDDLPAVIDGALRFAERGGRTIVEATSVSIGRDVRALELIARQSGVHIVAGCGYYIGRTQPRGFIARGVDDVVAELVEEINEGVEGTPIRAGVIGEIGPGQYPMTDGERLMLVAAAAAQRETGAGLVVHSPLGTDAPFEIVDVLRSAGADLSKTVVSHLDERFRHDLDLWKRLAESGVLLGLDTFGRDLYRTNSGDQHPSDAQRIDIVCDLIEAGLERQILLSHDVTLKHELPRYGGHGYDHILWSVLPRLRGRGVSTNTIDEITIRTPARLLALNGGRP